MGRVIAVDSRSCRWRGPYVTKVEAALYGEKTKTCEKCGEPYKPIRHWQRFCSRQCYYAAYRKASKQAR